MGYGVIGVIGVGLLVWGYQCGVILTQSYNNNPRVIITTVTTSSSVVDPAKKK